MIQGKKIVCVIPARLDSSRFPKKILADLLGKPLLQWVWEAANRLDLFDEVLIAIDAQETAAVVDGFKGKWVMTSRYCLTGTERLIEVQSKCIMQGDIWVNWQADEPFLSKGVMEDLLQSVTEVEADIWTLKTKIVEKEQIQDPTVCKVVCDRKGYALYFSRSPIPYSREKKEVNLFRHVGLYAYRAEALEKIRQMELCSIEEAESLEQLRFLFHGLKIQVNETQHVSIGIDLPEHLALAREYGKKQRQLGLLIENIPLNRV